MYQSEPMHQITVFFNVNNKKGKTNDDITDNKDSDNNNRCVSVTLSENCKKKKGKRFGFRIWHPGWPFCIYWLDACDVKNKHIIKDDLPIIININVSMWSLFWEDLRFNLKF